MAAQWYYTKGEERQGPVSSEELKSLAQSGALAPEDLVWKEGMDEWRPAASLKGLFGEGAAAASGEIAAPPARSTAGLGGLLWQIPHVLAACLLIASMFLPWWGFTLKGGQREFQEAFSEDSAPPKAFEPRKTGMNRFPPPRARRRPAPDMEKAKRIYKNVGWYMRNLHTITIDLRSIPFDRNTEEIDIRGTVWGWDSLLGRGAAFLGFAILPVAVLMLSWTAARRFRWVSSFLFAYAGVILGTMTLIWYLQSPGYDVAPVFRQSAHVGPYLVMGGTLLLLVFGVVDGITGLRTFVRERSQKPE